MWLFIIFLMTFWTRNPQPQSFALAESTSDKSQSLRSISYTVSIPPPRGPGLARSPGSECACAGRGGSRGTGVHPVPASAAHILPCLRPEFQVTVPNRDLCLSGRGREITIWGTASSVHGPLCLPTGSGPPGEALVACTHTVSFERQKQLSSG